MRLRLSVFVTGAVVSSLAMAGGVTTTDTGSSIPLGPLLVVVVIYGVLFKAFSRWPAYERWVVGASLLVLPLVATWIAAVAGWRVYFGGSSPVLYTLIFWAVVALLLAIAWWVLKRKTTLLSAPDAAGKAIADAEARERYVREWTAARDAQWRAAGMQPSSAPPSPAPAPSPALAPRPEQKPEKPAPRTNDAIFLSYRRHDSADATGRIYDRLVQHFGREQVFKDVDSIPLGVDFREHLGNVVGRCNTLIAVIGPQWTSATGPNGRRLDDKADFVRVEIEAALARNIPVIPVLIGGASLPPDSELPPSLGAITYRNGISVRPDPDFHRDMDRLIAGLQQHANG
ncbi:MAG TPA: TIR domain-containing protein [Burkholderiaceae bacterium]|nr:TIR domain-containing protein [Burkholderiaceae bacterium]